MTYGPGTYDADAFKKLLKEMGKKLNASWQVIPPTLHNPTWVLRERVPAPEPEIEFVAGTFYSIRVISLREDGLGPVTSYGGEVRFSDTTTWHTAVCNADYFYTPFRRSRPHGYHRERISQGCSCGFYSLYDPSYAAVVLKEYDNGGDIFFGVVENAGRILHHSAGLRAERIRLVAVSFKDARAGLRTRLKRRLLRYSTKNEIPIYLTLQEMLEKHPLSERPPGLSWRQ